MTSQHPSPSADRRLGAFSRLFVGIAARAARAERRADFVGDLHELRGDEQNGARWIAAVVSLSVAVLAARLAAAASSAFGELEGTLHPRTWRPLPSDLRSSVRRLARSPAFTLLSLATIAGGIACVVISTALLRGILYVELPYADGERLVALFTSEREGAELRNPTSPADFLAWQAGTEGQLESMTAARPWSPTLSVGDGIHKLEGLLASPTLFELLGTAPLSGRLFDRSALEDSERPVVLSYRLARRLGDDVARPGRQLRLDGESYRVVAIMPAGFVFPPFWADRAELWAPLDLSGDTALDRDSRYLRVFARLAPDASFASARAQLETAMSTIIADHPEVYDGVGAELEPLREPTVSESRPALLALGGASVAVLALVAFNLASLLVAQRLRRVGELRIRAALGASTMRLRTALLWETAVLTLAGAGLGLLLAALALPALETALRGQIPSVSSLQIDPLTVVVAFLTTLLLTAGVALPGAAVANRSGVKRAAIATSGARTRRRLIALQLTATVALLVGAGLLLRSFTTLASVDPGFRTDAVAAVRIDIAAGSHSDGSQQTNFYAALENRLTALPGIRSAGLINHLPIEGDLWRTRIFAPGISSPDDDVRAAIRVASPGYLASLGLELLGGRWIDDSDRSALSVVINRAAAESLWGDDLPIGRELAVDSLGEQGTRRRIVGVIEDVKQTGLGSAVVPEFYVPLSQNPFPFVTEMTLVARTSTAEDPTGVLVRSARSVLQDLDAAVPVYSARSLDDVLRADLTSDRLLSLTISGFAIVALALAAFGLFAVVAFTATSRTRELAVRLALGSNRRQLATVVLREGFVTAAIGIGAGLVLAAFSTAGLRPLLYGIDPLDASTFALVGLCVAAVSLLAISIPAVRASVRMNTTSLRS